MRYGVLIKDITKDDKLKYGIPDISVDEKGTAFIIESESFGSSNGSHWDGWFIDKTTFIMPQIFVSEITEEQYNEIEGIKKAPEMHPKLKEAFDLGDWGCQTTSVQRVLEAISLILEEAKK